MNKLIVITGPTASGKTQLAIEIAKEIRAEIVSFDSRQFYKEISVGTAKPTDVQLKLVPHHFIANISIQDEYNAGQYEKDAIALIDKLFSKNKYVVLTGGSGMYLDSILYGFDELPKVEVAVREKLNLLYKEEGLGALLIMLEKLDPEHYNNVDLNNPQRLIRALEITLGTGIPYSEQRKGKSKNRNFNPFLFGIDVERNDLYERINNRVDAMMEQGLLDEVKFVQPFNQLNSLQTVGYKELFDYLEGKTNLETAINLIKLNTRRFAKRQMTWLRKYNELIWVKPENAKKEIFNLIGE